MGKKKGKNYASDFKAKVALEGIRSDLTVNEISSRYGVHATQIHRWKQEALALIKTGFTGKAEKAEQNDQKLIEDLYQRIGQLVCENEFLKKRVWE